MKVFSVIDVPAILQIPMFSVEAIYLAMFAESYLLFLGGGLPGSTWEEQEPVVLCMQVLDSLEFWRIQILDDGDLLIGVGPQEAILAKSQAESIFGTAYPDWFPNQVVAGEALVER
ncbi:hypothetical protein [Archangium sp.]|uniref:hypothetical protein n=1 Tax=Archangium sp. TaxID=1872627 RepID=UPI00286C8EA2|nr:hypothetical protein [Archangium sp.]